MKKLSNRQKLILQFIQNNKGVSTKDILEKINKQSAKDLRRLTIIRDLDILLRNNFIFRFGQGRGVRYLPGKNQWLYYFDPHNYFETGPDERKIKFENFNFNIFKSYKFLFNDDEINKIVNINNKYQERLKLIKPVILQKEIERITIELSWKSSMIEGNTYTLLETENLIKENQEAGGHNRQEAIMILNHKKAIDFIFNNKKYFVNLKFNQIEELHRMITNGMGVKAGIRQIAVGITGTRYKPLDNQFQIIEAMDKTISLVNKITNPLEKALVINLLLAYIQPFEDGNKRTSRLLGNAVLLAYGFCPLSFRNIAVKDYKKAVLFFYEQNSALYFKELFVEQYKFAVDNYFLA